VRQNLFGKETVGLEEFASRACRCDQAQVGGEISEPFNAGQQMPMFRSDLLTNFGDAGISCLRSAI
jgi:hypothetical protein